MTSRMRLVGVVFGATVIAIAAMASSASAVTGSEIAALPLRDSLMRSENPLSNGGKWTGVSWAWESPSAGVDTTTGWHPSSSTTLQGAAWNPNNFSQSDAASVVNAVPPSENDYNMLWIDLSTAGTARSGYQLTWTQEAKKSTDQVQLLRISPSEEKVLGTVSTALTAGTTIALSDNGSSLTIWKSSGGSMTELKTISDSTYSGGYAAIEGGGSSGKLTEFKAGHLVPAPTFSWTTPASPAASTTPDIGGSAESGSTVNLYTNSSCTGTAVASGSAATFASPGIATSVSNNTTTQYHATATDGAGDVSPCSSTSAEYHNDRSEILVEGSRLEDFFLQECVPGRIDEVSDPLGSGKTVMSFEPHDTDVVENVIHEGKGECESEADAPTENPRAEAISGEQIEEGTEFWLRTRFFIPSSFPLIEGESWITLMEVYGRPFEGTSPWPFQLKPLNIEGTFYGDAFFHQRNETYAWDIPWFEEMITGRWNEVLLHEKLAPSGFVEEWFNGVKEKFFVPELELYNPRHEAETEKLEMATWDSSNDGEANTVRIGQYRKAEEFTPTPFYFEFVKAGKTKASVGG